jgi:nucleoid-associated protein YgaU
MGILDSFKKALGGKTEAEADKKTIAVPEPAPVPVGEEPAEQEPIPAVGPETVPIEQGSYTVQSGDTLWSIAESVYGDGSKYSKIFDANTELLKQPDRIFPGQELLIPGLDD